jgi:hypothetical protein
MLRSQALTLLARAADAGIPPRKPSLARGRSRPELSVRANRALRSMTIRKRSSAVPLSLVPALAAVMSCGPSGPQVVSGVDPCLPQVYNEAACRTAVQHNGYYYGGMWYRHAYTMPFLYYHNGYSGYVRSGGRVRSLGAGTYSRNGGPSASRGTVVRGGFGGIGSSRGFGGG